MLQIKEICKEYRTGKLIQKALDHVSLNLRDNEFVAILGPSGSGKTTLLNIIGGLDRYDSGDLVINGISTKKYKDRDWDSYRNHTIGFVFQSYNLIPHQTVLANVELALTISGVSKAERKKRAIEALKKVGLGEQLHKRPNQMSGGQMQRVAIARALVNNPDILLADEPTGALDSDTSIQVMDLLREVAKDRLVVMVTHNPELAEEYATRIVTLKDGVIRSDTDPFLVEDHVEEPVHRNMGKSSMSFLTALALSFNNLRTKKARTLLTSFAGSIGIIGIALILALSNGVNSYIKSVEEDTLSEYPLQIQSTGFDMTSLLASGAAASQAEEEKKEDQINVIQMVTSMFSTMNSNDLASLKAYLDSKDSHIQRYANAVEYTYNVSPQIYKINEKKIRQVNPDQTFNALGFGSASAGNSMMSSMMRTDVFYELPKESSLYENQYEIKAGHWPEKYNEVVVVLTSTGNISDFMMYSMGLRDPVELDDMIKQFLNEENSETPENLDSYTYEDLMKVTFRLVDSSDYYTYDRNYKVWKDKSEDEKYMKKLVENGEKIKVVGVAQATEESSSPILTSGIWYPSSLTEKVVEEAKNSEIVKAQMKDKKINIFTGEKFGEESKEGGFSMDSLFQVDEEALQKAFQIDTSALNFGSPDFSGLGNSMQIDGSSLDLSGLMNMGDIQMDLPDAPSFTMEDFMGSLKITATREDIQKLASDLLGGYQAYSSGDPTLDYTKLGASFQQYLRSQEARTIISNNLQAVIRESGIGNISTQQLQSLIVQIMTDYQQYAQANGYTDSSRMGEYLAAYLQTAQAQAILTQWLNANLNMDALTISEEQLTKIANELGTGYQSYAAANGLPDPAKMGEAFLNYLGTEDAQKLLGQGVSKMVDTGDLEKKIAGSLESYVKGMMGSFGAGMGDAITGAVTNVMTQIMGQITSGLQNMLTQSMGQMGSAMENLFRIDTDAFAKAITMNMDGDELKELMMSLGSMEDASYENNLKKLGYADFAEPSGVNIFPKDFESKGEIVKILDAYNDRMEKAGEDEKVITYTDVVGTLMSSVTDIVDIISYVLIAFVAISLVVSSIMIGVITYISVLERKKEIGILRAIGASKGNISQVFNAETIIIGFCAGLIGIGLSLLALIPGNALIHHLADNTNVNAVLPAQAAIILILLSVFLTFIGGLLPARKASKSDPVTALRTE